MKVANVAAHRWARTSKPPPGGFATSSSRKSRSITALNGSRRATPPTTRPKRCCTGSFAERGFKGCGELLQTGDRSQESGVRSQESGVRRQESGDRRHANPHVLYSCPCLLTPALIRPLLTVTRDEIIAYLAALNQPFREDSSNADPRFTRNRIRHELLPLLKSFNPDVVSALAHLADHAEEAHEIIALVAAEMLAKAERPRAGNTIILDVGSLGQSRAVIRSVLRFIWEREGWPMSEMGFDAWDRAVEVARGELSACDFPGGISMRHAGRVVQLWSSKFQVPSSKSRFVT